MALKFGSSKQGNAVLANSGSNCDTANFLRKIEKKLSFDSMIYPNIIYQIDFT